MISPSSQRALKNLGEALGKLREVTRRDEASLLTTAGRGVARRAIDLTPTPKSEAKGGIATHARKVIARYFDFAAQPITRKTFWSPVLKEELAKAWRRRNNRAAALGIVLSKFFQKDVQVVNWDPNLVYDAMNRRGQVRFRKGAPLVIDSPQRRKDLKEAQSRVGKAKAGWARGLVALGGKAPGWITRHLGEGQFVDKRTAADPSVEFINRSAWGGRSDEAARIRDNAMRGTAAALLKQAQILSERRLGGVARKAR